MYTEVFKFINAGNAVNKVKLHEDGTKVAVLLSNNQTVEVWDIADVSRIRIT